MQIHQQENLKMAFDYMKTENVGLVNCSGKDVNEGNENISKKRRSGLGGGVHVQPEASPPFLHR